MPKFIRSPNTADYYAWAVRSHLVPGLGHRRLAKLSADDVDEFLDAKASAGLSKSTLGHLRRVLIKALDHADRREKVRRNVARLTKTPDGPVAVRRSLKPAEARALLDAVAGDQLEALLVLGVALGLRPGELRGLSWRDVDVDACVVHVRQQAKVEDNKTVLGELKTERSRRSLKCPGFVIAALRRRQELQDLEQAAAGADWSTEWAAERLVFTTTNGTPIDPANLRRYFHQACRKAGIGRWTPYEMRHTAASLLSAEGVPLELLADTLGHDARMTREVYRHAVMPTVDAAAAPMDRLLGDSGAEDHDAGSPTGSPESADSTNAEGPLSEEWP